MEDTVPDYTPATTDCAALPSYSCKPHPLETALNLDACCCCSNTEGRHVHDSPTMYIDLGARTWGTETASFGHEGVIKGCIQLKDGSVASTKPIVSVGLIISVAVSGERTRTLWSQKKPLCDLSTHPLKQDETIKLSVPIPPTITINGQDIPSPPSLPISIGTTKAVVSYEFIISLSKKKGLFRSGTSICVPILYLPKTRPKTPPFKCYPSLNPCGRPDSQTREIHTVQLITSKFKSPPDDLEVFYSRPEVDSFASGSVIPITLTLRNVPLHDSRDYARQFAQNTSVVLYKRTRVASSIYISGTADHETKLAQIAEFSVFHVNERVWQLRGSLDTGTDGREMSWRIPGVIDVQYIVAIQLRSKSERLGFPDISYRDAVTLTTDPWASCWYEFNSTSGLSVPAIGLAKAQGCLRCRKPDPDSQSSSDIAVEARLESQKYTT